MAVPLPFAPSLPAPPENILAAISAASADAIVTKGLDGIVTSWNPGAERLFGYDADEMIGQHISKLFPPERQYEEPEILRRLKLGESVAAFETVRVHKDTFPVHVSVAISPVRNSEGDIVGAAKVARDLTSQRLAEEKITSLSAELMRRDKARVELVATLCHELRTPLNATIGWLEILKEPEIIPAEQAEGLAAVERNTYSQIKIVEDLLDISRIETGKITLNLQPLDMISVCREAISSVEPLLQGHSFEFTAHAADGKAVVMGDLTRLQQIIWNLLANAVKFTPQGGEIRATLSQKDSHIEFQVEDSGRGIPDEFMPVIFDCFRQADSFLPRQHGGLGLGLTICKQFTELHGGRLSARSKGLGKGSIFILTLPSVSSPQEDRPRSRA